MKKRKLYTKYVLAETNHHLRERECIKLRAEVNRLRELFITEIGYDPAPPSELFPDPILKRFTRPLVAPAPKLTWERRWHRPPDVESDQNGHEAEKETHDGGEGHEETREQAGIRGAGRAGRERSGEGDPPRV